MPHIVLEYSDNLEPEIDISALLTEMHYSLAAQNGVSGNVKSRAYPTVHFNVGTQNEDLKGFLHISLLLLAGRDKATKDRFSQPLVDLAKNAIDSKFAECAITLEVRDLDPETYIIA